MPEPTGTLYDTTGRLGDLFEDPQEEEPMQLQSQDFMNEECCEEIRQYFLDWWSEMNTLHHHVFYTKSGQVMAGDPTNPDIKRLGSTDRYYGTLKEWIENIDCSELLDVLGVSDMEPGKTVQQAYNECAGNTMPMGGDFTTGEPMDLAWRMLKHA